jgi:lambda repressor-like predicted transcriptional regulator
LVVKNTVNWGAIKADYINSKLGPKKGMSLRTLAEHWSVSYGTLRNKAATENWNAAITEEEQIRAERVTVIVREREVQEEAEVRLRQARVARMALSKAEARLKELNPSLLSVREVIDLLRLGLVEERAALGFAERYQFVEEGTDEHFKSVRQHIHERERLDVLAKRFCDFVEQRALSDLGPDATSN